MTPETPPDSSTGTAGRGPASATPKLADRLSALVGQASVRQDDTVSAERLVAAISARVDSAGAELRERIAVIETSQATRMQALESSVGERLAAIESALGSLHSDDGTDLKSHVDEVGGALVLRLDEVLAGLAGQVELTRSQAVGQFEETKSALAEVRHQLGEASSQLTDQAEVSRASLTAVVGGVDAALVDVHADIRGLPGLLETVAQAAQLDGVTATTTALRVELEAVVHSLADMRSQFAGLQDAIERRVDDAALALAETLVAVITSLPSSSPAQVSYELDDLSEPQDGPAEGGLDGDWAAADEPEDLVETLTSSELDDAAVIEESQEQASGVDEGGFDEGGLDDGRFDDGGHDTGAAGESPARRKGIFRR